MKIAPYTTIFLIVLWSILSVAQLWWEVVSTDTYWKITITMGLIAGVVISSSLIIREYVSDKKLKKDKFID